MTRFEDLVGGVLDVEFGVSTAGSCRLSFFADEDGGGTVIVTVVVVFFRGNFPRPTMTLRAQSDMILLKLQRFRLTAK